MKFCTVSEVYTSALPFAPSVPSTSCCESSTSDGTDEAAAWSFQVPATQGVIHTCAQALASAIDLCQSQIPLLFADRDDAGDTHHKRDHDERVDRRLRVTLWPPSSC